MSIDWGTLDIPEHGPRKVRRSASGSRLYYGMRVGLAVVLLGGFFLMNRDVNELHDLRVGGVQVQATVDRAEEHDGKNTTYSVDYRYLDQAYWYSFHEDVDNQTYQVAKANRQIPVTYLPQHPWVHRVGSVTDARETRERRFWIFATVFVGLLLTFLTTTTDSGIRAERELLQWGTAVPAMVTALFEERDGKITYYRCRYIYRSPETGASGSAEVKQTSPFLNLQEGDRLTALVSSDGKRTELLKLITPAELEP